MIGRLELLRMDIADHLAAIAQLFLPGAKLTLIVRNPGVDGDSGLIVGDDDLDLAAAELTRRRIEHK